MAKKRIPQHVTQEIQQYVASLRKDHIPIQEVYLFGSYAKGHQHQNSDIDLCIVSSKFSDPFEALQYLWKKRAAHRGFRVEPVGFSPKDFRSNSPLIHEIKSTGIRLDV